MNRPLDAVLEAEFPVAVLRLAGQLDLPNTTELRAALGTCLAAQPSAVVVDLSGLALGDEIALTAFTAFARHAAAWPGCPVVLCAPPESTRAGLARLAVDRYLPVHPTREQALVAVAELPAPRRYWRRLRPSPHSPHEAREMIVEACTAWSLPGLADHAELVVTELVSNAVLHAKTRMEVSVVLRDRFLHIAVSDGCREVPRRQPIDPATGEGGRGLLLVDALAAGWGSLHTADGKVVWATLRTDQSRRPRRSGNRGQRNSAL